MTPASVLRPQLVVPPLRPEWVGRPGLLSRLDEVRRPGKRLALLSAPAGYGKTALVTAWAHALDAQSWGVAWITLSERERDIARFLQVLSAALGPWGVEPDLLQLSPLGALRPPITDQLLIPLLNQVDAALEGDVGGTRALEGLVLVLDDAHLAAAPRVHDALSFLLEALPLRMRLVVTTRVDPPWAPARLRARGELVELRAADLRFSTEEIGALTVRVGLNLPPEALTTLEARTEGWPAGLQLAALSLRGREDPAALVGDLGATQRHLLDFLLQEVVERQPPRVQQFLLASSILEQLTAPLCESLLDLLDGIPVASPSPEPSSGPARDASAEELLTYVERANLFLLPMDDRREWYRYHRLFADLLGSRLIRAAPDLAPELHRRASTWYEREGLMHEAVDHALVSGAPDRVAALLAEHGEALLMRSETEALRDWLAALPDATIADHPLLDVWYAAALLFGGRPAAEVGEHLARATAGGPQPDIAGASGVIKGILALLQGDAARAVAATHRALELLSERHALLRLLGESTLGMAQVVTGDLGAAVETYERLLATAGQGAPVAIAIGPLSNLGGLAMIRGELRRAATVYGRVLELGRDRQGRRLVVTGKALMGLGEVEREQDQLEAAVTHLEEGIALTRRLIEMGAVVGYVSLMMARQARGDAEGAREAVQSARELALRSRATELDDHFVDCFEVWLWVLQGNLGAVRRWIADDAQRLVAAEGGGAQEAEFRELAQLVLARARLALGESEAALSMLAPLEAAVVRRTRMRRAMEVWVLQALALHRLGREEAALAPLSRALDFGEPEGFVRVFVDEGAAMVPLLYGAVERGISQHYAGRLLARLTEPETVLRSAAGNEVLIEPLSEREIEVLGLIERGLSNAEIAQTLTIALSTVKGHTTNIYGKLGVRTRTQAVARARALGLLGSM